MHISSESSPYSQVFIQPGFQSYDAVHAHVAISLIQSFQSFKIPDCKFYAGSVPSGGLWLAFLIMYEEKEKYCFKLLLYFTPLSVDCDRLC